VKWGGTSPLPGTPASGEYVYRKAIPSENGRDVTELQIRTPRHIDLPSRLHRSPTAGALSTPFETRCRPEHRGNHVSPPLVRRGEFFARGSTED